MLDQGRRTFIFAHEAYNINNNYSFIPIVKGVSEQDLAFSTISRGKLSRSCSEQKCQFIVVKPHPSVQTIKTSPKQAPSPILPYYSFLVYSSSFITLLKLPRASKKQPSHRLDGQCSLHPVHTAARIGRETAQRAKGLSPSLPDCRLVLFSNVGLGLFLLELE